MIRTGMREIIKLIRKHPKIRRILRCESPYFHHWSREPGSGTVRRPADVSIQNYPELCYNLICLTFFILPSSELNYLPAALVRADTVFNVSVCLSVCLCQQTKTCFWRHFL